MKIKKALSACLVCAAIAVSGLAWSATNATDTALKAAVVSGKPTLLEFGAPWCSACTHTLPVIEAVARDKKYFGRVNVLVVNIDDNERLRSKYRINSIPVQVFLDSSGNEMKRHFGGVDKKELEKILDQVMSGKIACK